MKFTLSIFIYVFGLMLFLNFLHAHSISIGDNVSMVADNVKVRTCPLLSCSDNGRVSIYTVGIVEDGPRDEDGYYWWKVDWEDNSPDGWTPTPKNDYSWYYEKPTGLSPGGSSSNPPVIDDAAPQLSWNKVDGVHHYTVTIIEKSSGDVTYHDNINGSSTSYTLPSSLEEGKRYLWSVLPYDDDDDMGLKADYIYFDVKSQAESSYDLRIRPEDITIHSQSGDDDTINVGEMFDIRVNVHNVGDANSDSYRVKYYYKGASSGDFGSYFDTDSDSGTDAGDSDSETSNDKEVDGGSGTHWVKVCVYDNNDDSDHNNDCGIQSFPVQGNSNPDPDPNILTISTIDPNPIISSTSKQNIMISGSNFTSASRIMWKTSSGNNGIVSDEGTFFVDSSNIRVYIRVTSTSSTWSFKVVNDDGSESEWKSVPNQKDNTPSRPVLIHDEDAVKGGRSGEAIPFDFIAYDLDDLANGEIYYTLVVNWGDGSAVSSTQVEYSEEPVTLTHAYNTNQTGTYTAVAYAVDSSGTKSSDVYIPVKIQGSDPASVPIENTMYNRKEIANATGEICRSEGRSIDKATGAENFSITPLKVKGLFDLPFTLQYNSVLLSGEQYISKGWSHNYHFSSKITEIENGNYRVYWDNSAKKYNDFKYDLSKQHYVSDEKAVLDDVLKIDNDGRLKLIRKNGAIYQYSNLGYLSSISNYKNQKIEITFDDDGRLRKVEEPVSSVFLTYSYNNDGKLASVKDGLGRITYLKYNSDGLLKEIEAPDSAIRYKFQYNNQEQLYKYIFVDTDGSETLYFDITYDTNGRASEEDDSKGNTSWFYFNTTNEADKIHSTYTDNVGRSTKTVYDDTNFNVYQIEHPDGTKEYLEYYANGKKKSWKNRAGKDTKYYYDDNGNLNKVIYSDGSEEQYTYDNNRNITFKKIIDKNANQYITHNIYDEYNNLTKTELPNGDYTTYTYNDNNQMVTKTINNKMTTYRYNDKGYLQEVETPLGLKTLYAYDGAGRLIAETDPQGGITTYTYDVMDRVTAIKNSMNKTKTTEYDFMGHKSKESDFMGNYTQYEYDLNGNMIKKVDALSNEYLFVYDSADRLSTSSDPLGHTVSYEYDSMGRVSKTTDARGNDTTYEYDAMGNLKKQYDAYGNRLFTKKYDTKNNLIEVVDGLNRKTITTYTVFDKPSKVTDPLARVTEFKYDKVGRLIKAINAQNKEATQSYNDLGQISAFTDPNSNETSFTYSDDGHMLSTATASGSVMTNTYKDGLLDRVTNGRGDTTTLKYDALGRVIEAQNTDGVIPYTYDDNSNLLTITENGKTITRVYDRLNRVINHTDIYNETIGYEYDAIGNLMKLIYPDGKEVGYSYDENSNLIEVKEGSLKTSYEYDKNSRLVKMTRPNGTVLDRIYDEVGQLTSQTDKTSSGIIIVSVSFGYDKAGNIIKEDRYPTIKPVLPTAISISYKSGNLLDEANQTTATFDADDNMVAFGARTYYYDSRNRLYQNGTATYSYDSENHRVSQTINGKTTKYTINPEASLSQLLSLTEPNGTQTTYTYGLGLVAQEKNGKKLYYHYDLRGSTIALTDKSGNIVDRWSYLPFGGQISHDVGTTKTPFLYNGRDGVMTDESGLYYMRARYYDPGIRRFINRDTLLGDVGQMATLNRFGYVNGNPVSGVDPSGHIAWVPIIAVALIIIDWATDASVAYSPENKNNEKELIENSDNVTKYYDQANYVAGYVNPVKKLFREIPTHIMRQSLANTRKNTKYKQKFNTLVQQSEKKIKQEFREISVHNTVSAIEEAADYHNSQNRFNITEKPYATPIGSPKNAFILRPYMFENCD